MLQQIFSKLNDGGPVITYTILILLVVILVLFVRSLKDRENTKKNVSLIASIAWFAVAWGFLGRTIGLIISFDRVAQAGEVTPFLLAEGLKMAVLGPLLGIIVFLIARAGIIYLQWSDKGEE